MKRDGSKDGAFDVTVEGPIKALLLASTNTAGNLARGQFWDTVAGDATRTLGVQEGGVLLNRADSSIPELSAGVHHLKIYDGNSGYFVNGQPFHVFAILDSGAQLGGPVLVYGPPGP